MKSFVMAVIVIGTVFLMGCAGTRPVNIGVTNGSLGPCPGKPNCVSSVRGDSKHFIEPLIYHTSNVEAFDLLKQVLEKQKRTTIVKETENYLHVEFKTLVFRFVDDVEFYFPENKQEIQVRSASRLGYSDLGVNRKRMEAIRSVFYETLNGRK